MTTRRQFLQFAGAALTVPAFPSAGVAQAWPTRTIRAMIPFAAGSSLDIVGRLVLDPYRVLDGVAARAAGLDHRTLGVS